ncbi:MAG TPA: hypothetical protein VLU96_07085 [Gaiellaceae bacterium]|nr:hypothetical protein [Gaiellaceae bacterium]
MALLAKIVGAILGFAVGVLFTEVIFANNQEWPIVVPFALAVLGWLLGGAAARRFAQRHVAHP